MNQDLRTSALGLGLPRKWEALGRIGTCTSAWDKHSRQEEKLHPVAEVGTSREGAGKPGWPGTLEDFEAHLLGYEPWGVPGDTQAVAVRQQEGARESWKEHKQRFPGSSRVKTAFPAI